MFKKNTELAFRRPGFVEIDCSASGSFRAWTAEQLYKVVDNVAAAHASYQAGRHHDQGHVRGHYNVHWLECELAWVVVAFTVEVLSEGTVGLQRVLDAVAQSFAKWFFSCEGLARSSWINVANRSVFARKAAHEPN